jgi:hypothetical protein
MLGRWASRCPRCRRRRGRFGRPSAALVHVVQDNVDQEVSWIINTCTLHSKAAQIFGQAIPAIELTEVNIVNLKSSHIFESKERHSRVKRELLVAGNETSLVVGGEPQTRNLGKGRVEISQIFLELCLLPFCFGRAVGAYAERRP